MAGKIRTLTRRYCNTSLFNNFILCVIILNTFTLILATFQNLKPNLGCQGSHRMGCGYFDRLDNFFLGIYMFESAVKMYAFGVEFWKETWNLIDLLIGTHSSTCRVLVSMLDFILPVIAEAQDMKAVQIFRLLRIFRAIRAVRALRMLRTIRFLRDLQVIVSTCLHSMQSMGAILMLIMLFIYMFAIIGRGLYGTADPQRFGSIWTATFSLIQLLTLDDWFDFYTDIEKTHPDRAHIIFFLTMYVGGSVSALPFSETNFHRGASIWYIIVEYFIFLNLFVAVLVDNFQIALDDASDERILEQRAADAEIDALSAFEEDTHSKLADKKAKQNAATEHPLRAFFGKKGLLPEEEQLRETLFSLQRSFEAELHIFARQKAIIDQIVDFKQDSND